MKKKLNTFNGTSRAAVVTTVRTITKKSCKEQALLEQDHKTKSSAATKRKQVKRTIAIQCTLYTLSFYLHCYIWLTRYVCCILGDGHTLLSPLSDSTASPRIANNEAPRPSLDLGSRCSHDSDARSLQLWYFHLSSLLCR